MKINHQKTCLLQEYNNNNIIYYLYRTFFIKIVKSTLQLDKFLQITNLRPKILT